MSCIKCSYNIGDMHKGICEYCRSEYGTLKNSYIQKETKRVYTETELEEVTDGQMINKFGHGVYRKDKEGEK